MRIVILTYIPSPYQVELFNALARFDGWALSVIYANRSAKERAWKSMPIAHEHCFFVETPRPEIARRIIDCDLVVFGGYQLRKVGGLIKLRNSTGKPWAFWGERPGFRFAGWLGRQYRAWALREIRFACAPVWGIGEWAISGYRSELGESHRFFNVPYASDLTPFLAIERRFAPRQCCRFLFSGSFIHRKGFDLLICAFERLIAEGVDAELNLLGAGPLKKLLKAKSPFFESKVRMHGFKQWEELASVYAEADILCAPSRYDGWGLIVVEGLAAGMPVISTNCTGSARELIEPRNGWLIPAGNEEALYLAMKSAATLGVEHRKAMSDYARRSGRGQHIETGVRRVVRAAEMTVNCWKSDNSQPTSG